MNGVVMTSVETLYEPEVVTTKAVTHGGCDSCIFTGKRITRVCAWTVRSLSTVWKRNDLTNMWSGSI